jgi:nitrogen fixation/metabolism regulation signal transduction histidine kinase
MTLSRDAHPAPFEQRVFVIALGAALPAVATALGLLWLGDYSTKVRWTLTAVVFATWLGFATYLRDRLAYSLRSVTNLLAALREGDYSIRLRPARTADAMNEVIGEVNALGDLLHRQRVGAAETGALLEKVLARIDVAVLAFDDEGRLQRINPRGERLLGEPANHLLGRNARSLGLADCLSGPTPRILEFPLASQTGRWEVRRATFREQGRRRHLLVFSDLTAALRQEERDAWQRLVRVLRHEVNNSLAPIHSLALTLAQLLRRTPRPSGWEDDLVEGLEVIAGRSAALNRMMASYARLTGLPPPTKDGVDVESWVRRAAVLETRRQVTVVPGPPVHVRADRDQLEQLLINVVRNAAEAALETGGQVQVGWTVVRQPGTRGVLEVWIDDEGPGLADTDNLFVPFFTTKPGGCGIGLALGRQIAEAHGGSLTLDNRLGQPGARATIRLPLCRRGRVPAGGRRRAGVGGQECVCLLPGQGVASRPYHGRPSARRAGRPHSPRRAAGGRGPAAPGELGRAQPPGGREALRGQARLRARPELHAAWDRSVLPGILRGRRQAGSESSTSAATAAASPRTR